MIDHQRLQAVPFDDWNAVAESAVRDAVRRAMKGVLTEDQAVAAVAAVIDERRATVTTKAREAAEGA
ncbi:MAG: hypothetical protein P4M15_07150, partial [Alphaproteobacteria bacterium]|nr:hypothetical protein [Alphaproteobacteria bacterium]